MLDGRGIDRDYGEALRLLEAAAEQHLVAAYANLGYVYAEGLGVARDYGKARDWFEMAAAGRDPYALGWLGELYMKGLGVDRDEAAGLAWYRAAAATGDELALARLGDLYRAGEFVERNQDLAWLWYRAAMARGNAELAATFRSLGGWIEARAEAMLGAAILAYERNRFAEAFERLQPLALAGDARAQLYLGEIYRDGHGAVRDLVEAAMWLSLAAERLPPGADRDRAVAARDEMARQLTAADLTEARRRGREWKWPAS